MFSLQNLCMRVIEKNFCNENDMELRTHVIHNPQVQNIDHSNFLYIIYIIYIKVISIYWSISGKK